MKSNIPLWGIWGGKKGGNPLEEGEKWYELVGFANWLTAGFTGVGRI